VDFLSYRMIVPIDLGFIALGYLYIAIRGFATRKPFLISAQWFFLFMVPLFLPSLISPFMLRSKNIDLGLLTWVSPLFFLFFIGYFWKVMKGYTAYGVTDKSFRKSLLASLEKLNLKHKESLNGIYLESHDITLKASVFFMGMGRIRVQGKEPDKLLKKIINKMKKELAKPGTEFDIKPFFFYFGIAAIFLILTISEISLFQQVANLYRGR